MNTPLQVNNRRRLLRAALFAGMLYAVPAPPARAEIGEADRAYEEHLARLKELLERRQAAENRLASAISAERTALGQLTSMETTLRRLVSTQSDLADQASALSTDMVEVDARLGALDLALREAYGAGDTDDLRAALVTEREQIAARLASMQRTQAGVADRLGQANTEIAYWQREADATARRIGNARERALRASAEVADLQERGEKLASEVQSSFEALQNVFTSLSSSLAVSLLELEHSAPEPVIGKGQSLSPPPSWPAGPAPRYAPPRGAMAGPLVAGGPLFTDTARLRSLGDLPEDPAEWVAPLSGPITTQFGESTPYSSTHWGIDIGARLYTPVVAATHGRVEYAGLATVTEAGATYGMAVLLRHGRHLTSLYGHLDAQAYGPAVRVGDQVSPGQVIGYVGLTGYSTGPHLHLELRHDNRPVDPRLLVL